MHSPAAQYLYQLLGGAQVAQPLAAAAKLRIADSLAEGPLDVNQLAAEVRCHAGALERLLRALLVLGIVTESSGCWALTEAGKLLREGVPGSVRDVALLAGEPWRAAAFDLAECVRDGQPAFARRFGSSFYQWLEQHPAEGARFDAVQAAHTGAVDLAGLDLAGVGTIVDVGGGSGALLARLLGAHPALSGVLCDLPGVAARAAERFGAAGLGDRARAVGGDFFEAVPEGGDLYLLVFVLHNWDDARAARILDRCARAMRPGARLAIVENLLGGARPSPTTALLDLEMLVFHDGGRERSEAEYRALVEGAGFAVTQVVPSGLLIATYHDRDILDAGADRCP